MKDFFLYIEINVEIKVKIDIFRGEVESFVRGFLMFGFDNY